MVFSIGETPISSAFARQKTTTAEAPSFNPGALLAVTFPPLANAGRNFDKTSIEVSRCGVSATLKMLIFPLKYLEISQKVFE